VRDIARKSKLQMEKDSIALLKENGYTVSKEGSTKCPICEEYKIYTKYTKGFYPSHSPLSVDNHTAFCKDCIKKIYTKYYETTDSHETAVYICCLKFDYPFVQKYFESAMSQFEKSEAKKEKEDENYDEKNIDYSIILSFYIKNITSLGRETSGVEFDIVKLLESKTDKKTENNSDFDMDVELTELDHLAIKEVINIIGYDPFAGSSKFDQKFLYNELIPHLDEDTVEDTFKLSQIFQVISNNNQIRKIDLVISKMSKDLKSLVDNGGTIKSLQSTKYQIVQATDKIARENGISEKHRKGGSINKSTLTGMMMYYRDIGLDDAEVDFYDQNVCFGMQRANNISMKAIFEQGLFNDNEYAEILQISRELVKKLERQVLDLEEEKRLLYVKIDELKIK